ncbi:hypothetical protein [Aquipuribacter sp. MA13-6]|uniref:hypothetical protein n=1 Tax=unclassified Aquipuribacter TaxID=2635084 RepID=UPI003EECD5C4
MSSPTSPAATASPTGGPAPTCGTTSPPRGGPDLGPAEGWQGRFLGWLNRRRRLSVLVPVVVVVLGAPHSCPFC